jgi:hypothetical protein
MIMIVQLVSLALIIAVWLFALSLPFGESNVAKSLRRGAAFSFAIVFVLPLVAYGFLYLVGPLVHGGYSHASAIETGLAIVGLVALVVTLSFAAYGYLNLRSTTRCRRALSHSPGVRFGKQRPGKPAGHHSEEDHD